MKKSSVPPGAIDTPTYQTQHQLGTEVRVDTINRCVLRVPRCAPVVAAGDDVKNSHVYPGTSFFTTPLLKGE